MELEINRSCCKSAVWFRSYTEFPRSFILSNHNVEHNYRIVRNSCFIPIKCNEPRETPIWQSTSWIINISVVRRRHLEVSTFACVGNCKQYHHCKARPQKHGRPIWILNFRAIWSTSWVMSIFALTQTLEFMTSLGLKSIRRVTIGQPDLECMVLGFEIRFLSC